MASSTRIITANGMYDLSNVTTLKDLREEIDFLKASIKKDEAELEKHIRKLPHQLVKSTADSLLPSFLNKLIANGTWKLLLSGVGMFANPFSGKFSFKKNILGSAKKIGVFALLKSAYGMWSNKKQGKSTMQPALKNAPAVTTLKAQRLK